MFSMTNDVWRTNDGGGYRLLPREGFYRMSSCFDIMGDYINNGPTSWIIMDHFEGMKEEIKIKTNERLAGL